MITVSDEAVTAGRKVLLSYGNSTMSDSVIRHILEAAVPHLTDAGLPLGLASQYACCAGDPLAHAPSCERNTAERPPLIIKIDQRMSDPAKVAQAVREAFQKVTPGRYTTVEPEQFTGELVTTGPTDYEVWRDALLLSATANAGQNLDHEAIRSDAASFHALLLTDDLIREVG